MEHRATLIPGDGIGPEVTQAATRVVEAAGVQVNWERVEAGADVFVKYGTPLPDEVLNSIRTTGVALKGPIGTPIGGGFKSANVLLRQSLDLYACVRPIQTIPGVPSRYSDVDFVIVRENTEGLYSGLEHRVTAGVVESLKVVTETASLRIARYAFELAREQKRPSVAAIHKANIMKLSDGLFLECARRVARDYPEIELRELIIDNCAMQLVTRPEQFDVLLMDNLYGDILSDLGAGLVGGLGVVPGSNVGSECAVFEAVHGSAPDLAGQGKANPTAVIRSAAQLVAHLGEIKAAARIENAVVTALSDPAYQTGDLGGKATTSELTDAILHNLD
ncbi:MAG: isocitrate/isopropylmalate dehydrogenase family protein [Myxococcales bacterium]|nr:isocitrate/isopropylmalate dehydrogenase family protein [Myxococcales bacterium]HIK85102.1 isocitrate/isopropylmalate dehydrogenase family protein [Myxococcales bacterium]